MAGVHCRLENISETGEWLQAETFHVGDVVCSRKKGEKAGNIMQSWRQCRAKEPELFRDIKVWQSPTAFVDGVIWAWQQHEESARFESLVRIVDSLATCWSPDSTERNFLCQTVQASVPPGCTPLMQVTDTGFAMPAKAAAREEHERQRKLLLLKARTEKVAPVYKVGAREMLQTAQAMHKRMVELNTTRQAVIAESRCAGWLHWRPDITAKVLVKADSQQWAKRWTEGSSRMGPSFRERRDSFVEHGLPVKMVSRAEQLGEPRELQVSYFNEDADDLELTGQPDLMTPQEQLQLTAALLHPAVRTRLEQELAELTLMTSQKPREKSKKASTPQATRAEKAADWRKNLQYSTVKNRLCKLTPAAGKKKNKAVKKALKGKPAGKMSMGRKLAKKASEKLKAAAKKAAAKKMETAAEASNLHLALVGKTVRVISPQAGYLWRNAKGSVQKASGNNVTVLLAGTKTCKSEFPGSEVWQLTGKEKAALPAVLDFRRLTLLQKLQALKASGNEIKFADESAMLEGPELTAIWTSVTARGVQAGDGFAEGQLVYLEPHSQKPAVGCHLQEAFSEEATLACEHFRDLLQSARESSDKCLIAAPVCSEAPRHWTALVLRRAEGSKFEISFYDSLSETPETAKIEVRRLLTLLLNMLGSDKFSEPELPLPIKPVLQADGWSCGYHCSHRLEEEYRQFRGEGKVHGYQKVKETRLELNKWVKALLEVKVRPEPQKAAPEKKASSSSSVLPPKEASSSSSSSSVPPPLPPPFDAALPAAVLAAQPTGLYGCSKCRHAVNGCCACNPEKMYRHASK